VAFLLLLLWLLSRNPTPVLAWGGQMLQHWDPVPSTSDAIFILLGEAAPRAAYAAILFREGCAPVIGMAQPQRERALELGLVPAEHAVACSVLTSLGVSRDHIVVLTETVTSTYDEARVLTRWSLECGYKHILAVTSSYHSRRAYWTLRRCLEPHGIEITIGAVPYPYLDWIPWWKTEDGLVTVFNETAKTLYYWLHYRGIAS
jgi:uncharacterized SAM-binding protein YcdF (DUF218 family)